MVDCRVTRLDLLAASTCVLLGSSLGEARADNPWDAAFGKGVAKQGATHSDDLPSIPPPLSRPPTPSQSRVEAAQARADAESLVATFNAAVDAGATAFSTMRSTEQVIAALASGVRGGGRYADTTFRVPGLDASRQAAALAQIHIERGRIVVGAPPKPVAVLPKEDPRASFAGGKMKVQVPQGFAPEISEGGDLLLRGDGVHIRLHLEAFARGLDAWREVRGAAERASLPVSMAGKKVYIVEPERRAPKSITVGFANAIVTMTVEGDPGSPGYTQLRFALPGLIGSLATGG